MAGRQSVIARVGWLAAELAVVFIGVYGAFWLDGVREQQRLDVRRDQIVTTLCAETEDLRTHIPNFVAAYDSLYVQPFTEALEAGERPLPHPLDFYTGSFDTGMWDATLASGGLDALDYETIRRAQQFYSKVSTIFSYSDSFLDRMDRLVLPRLDQGVDAFYTNDGRLKPTFAWYQGSLFQLRFMLNDVSAEADSLHNRLDCATPTTD